MPKLRGCYNSLQDMAQESLGRYSYLQCLSCGSIQIEPIPDSKDWEKLYPKNYFTHSTFSISKSNTKSGIQNFLDSLRENILHSGFGYNRGGSTKCCFFSSLLAKIPILRTWASAPLAYLPYVPHGRLLDIGCGNGDFLIRMQTLGWNCEGIELDDLAVQLCRSRGLRVKQQAIEDLELEPESYDAIVLSHVIEHISEPEELLSKLSHALNDTGTLVCISPNPLGLLSRFFREHWRALDVPRHFVLPSPNGYISLMSKVGLQATIRTSQRIGRWNYFESLGLKRGNTESIGSNFLQRFVIQVILSTFSMIVPNSGEEIICIARKGL